MNIRTGKSWWKQRSSEKCVVQAIMMTIFSFAQKAGYPSIKSLRIGYPPHKGLDNQDYPVPTSDCPRTTRGVKIESDDMIFEEFVTLTAFVFLHIVRSIHEIL